MDVIFSEHDVTEPDLLSIAKDRKSIITEDNIQGAPDLVVEVISESTRKRDVLTKRRIYERYGVRFYWLVDPEEETVRVFELRDGGYPAEPVVLHPGQALACPLFPEVSTDVAELFRPV